MKTCKVCNGRGTFSDGDALTILCECNAKGHVSAMLAWARHARECPACSELNFVDGFESICDEGEDLAVRLLAGFADLSEKLES